MQYFKNDLHSCLKHRSTLKAGELLKVRKIFRRYLSIQSKHSMHRLENHKKQNFWSFLLYNFLFYNLQLWCLNFCKFWSLPLMTVTYDCIAPDSDSFHIYGFALKWNIVSVYQFGSSLGPRICLLKEQNWIRMWENGKLIVLDVVEKVPFQLLLIIVITNIFIVITSVIVEITTIATITKWQQWQQSWLLDRETNGDRWSV